MASIKYIHGGSRWFHIDIFVNYPIPKPAKDLFPPNLGFTTQFPKIHEFRTGILKKKRVITTLPLPLNNLGTTRNTKTKQAEQEPEG